MEREGYVSLWIGNIKSDDELIAYVELEYTDDGDCIPSKFLKDFSMNAEKCRHRSHLLIKVEG